MRIKDWSHRKDDNHREITKYFEELLCKTKDVSSIPGFCDLLVKRGNQVAFVEIKDPTKAPSKRRLTPAEQEFADYWGNVDIVETFEDVMKVVRGLIGNRED